MEYSSAFSFLYSDELEQGLIIIENASDGTGEYIAYWDHLLGNIPSNPELLQAIDDYEQIMIAREADRQQCTDLINALDVKNLDDFNNLEPQDKEMWLAAKLLLRDGSS